MRVKPDPLNPISVKKLPEYFDFEVLDFSARGIRLVLKEKENIFFSLNQSILLKISLPGYENAYVEGNIRHIKKNDLDHVEFGLEFQNMDENTKHLFHHYIEMSPLPGEGVNF